MGAAPPPLRDALSGVILLITVWQFTVIPKGFLPEIDASSLNGYTLAAQGISFDAMKEHQEQLDKILMPIQTARASFPALAR